MNMRGFQITPCLMKRQTTFAFCLTFLHFEFWDGELESEEGSIDYGFSLRINALTSTKMGITMEILKRVYLFQL